MSDDLPKRSGSHDRQAELGGEFIESAGFETPYYYTHNEQYVENYDYPDHVELPDVIGAEHHHTREQVAMTSLPYTVVIEIWGPSSPEFVQRMFSNDMDVDVGRSRYAAMLNEDGGVLGDLVVSRLDEDRYFAFSLSGETAKDTTEWLRDHAPSDVAVQNMEDGYGCIGVYGPNALDVMQPLTSTDLSRDALPFYGITELEIEGIPCYAVRLSYVGEFGWEFWTPSGHESQLWEVLWDATENQGGTVFGVGALVSLGLEKGYHELGQDVGPDYTPYESGLGHFVDLDTDFIGKDAIDEDVDEIRVCLTMDESDVLPEGGDDVLVDGEALGEVVRAGYGYTVDENIAFAFLPTEHAEAGTSVEVERPDGPHPATLRDSPVFDPDDSRLR